MRRKFLILNSRKSHDLVMKLFVATLIRKSEKKSHNIKKNYIRLCNAKKIERCVNMHFVSDFSLELLKTES